MGIIINPILSENNSLPIEEKIKINHLASVSIRKPDAIDKNLIPEIEQQILAIAKPQQEEENKNELAQEIISLATEANIDSIELKEEFSELDNDTKGDIATIVEMSKNDLQQTSKYLQLLSVQKGPQYVHYLNGMIATLVHD